MSTVIQRSALRHRPIHLNEALPVEYITPRASRARKQRDPHTTGGLPSVAVQAKPRTVHWMVPPVLAMLATLVLIWLVQMVWASCQLVYNDVHYGRPRTAQYDVAVGHGDSKEHPSHFIAFNERGQAYIIELPGGDATRAKTYVGPKLSGDGADLVPVTLQFVERPHDHVSDMIVRCGDIEVKYHNVDGAFIPQPAG
jgi:hypothetical protein